MFKDEIYFSRSHAELGDKCPKARYWHTFHGERGIVAIGGTFELSYGSIIHRATEWVLTERLSLEQAADYAASAAYKLVIGGGVPSRIPDEFHDQFSREAKAMAAGMVWAWGLHVLPSILANYNILQVEKQAVYRADGFAMPTVADVLLEAKCDRTLVYPDWKTAQSVNKDWMDQWLYSAQLHTTARAIEQTLGREVEYCYVQALVKGRWMNGYQQSPLVWGYYNPEPDDEKRAVKKGVETTPQLLYKHTQRKGWKRTPQWLSGLTPEQWVRGMPEEVAMKVVPRTHPIVIDQEKADRWWRQHVIKEKRYREAKATLNILDRIGDKQDTSKWRRHTMDMCFPMDDTQCKPFAGFRCDYFDCCYDPTIGADPIGSGLYRRRPTHTERLKEESVNE